jgi:hypothetical protein
MAELPRQSHGLPDDVVAAIECAQEGIDHATRWLAAHGREVSDEGADELQRWAERILGMIGRAPAAERRPASALRAEARQAQLEFGPTVEPRGGGPLAVEVDKGSDAVWLRFRLSLAQFWALEAAGRADARSRNVEYLGAPTGVAWTDELCARWAIQDAIAAAYPAIVEAPRIGEEARRAA